MSAAARLRAQRPELVTDPDDLHEEDGRALFAAARSALRGAAAEQPALLAREMESVLGAAKRAPGVWATLGLLLLYLFGFACALAGIFGVTLAVRPVDWRTVHASTWRAEFPNEPFGASDSTGLGGAPDSSWGVLVNGTDRFRITVSAAADGPTWMAGRAAVIGGQSRMQLAASRPVTVAGRPGVEYEYTAPHRVLRARMAEIGGRRFLLTASAPKWGADQRRFLDSFAVSDSLR